MAPDELFFNIYPQEKSPPRLKKALVTPPPPFCSRLEPFRKTNITF